MECWKVSLWLCFAFSSMLLNVSSAQTRTSYKKRSNCAIKMDFVLESQISDSVLACTLICKEMDGCVSISWNTGTHTCLLSGSDTIAENENPYSRAYEMSSGSVCVSEVRFPVFIAKKTTYATHRYEMTYQEAVERCLELGTSIASEDDVTLEQSLGLYHCECGWISNGRNALILPYYDGSCWYTFNAGPIYCDWSYTDVWCKT